MSKVNKIQPCKDGVTRAVETYRVDTPIGIMFIKACKFGLHMLYMSLDITDANFEPNQSTEVKFLSAFPKSEEIQGHLQDTVHWLQTYFTDVKETYNTPLPAFCTISENGNFRERVQITLAKKVKAGDTVSYSELASLAGSPGAQQSVGTAMSQNPFQLIVPCHRVVKSDRKVGNYSSGKRNSVKVWLLQHEGLMISDDMC